MCARAACPTSAVSAVGKIKVPRTAAASDPVACNRTEPVGPSVGVTGWVTPVGKFLGRVARHVRPTKLFLRPPPPLGGLGQMAVGVHSGKVLAGRVRLRDDSRQGCVATSAFGSGAAACGEGHAPQAQPHPSVNLGFGRFSSEMRESHPFPGVAAATGHVSVAGLQAAQSAAQRLTLLRRGVCYGCASTPRGSPTPLVRPCGPPPHSQLPPSGKMRAPLLLGGGAMLLETLGARVPRTVGARESPFTPVRTRLRH